MKKKLSVNQEHKITVKLTKMLSEAILKNLIEISTKKNTCYENDYLKDCQQQSPYTTNHMSTVEYITSEDFQRQDPLILDCTEAMNLAILYAIKEQEKKVFESIKTQTISLRKNINIRLDGILIEPTRPLTCWGTIQNKTTLLPKDLNIGDIVYLEGPEKSWQLHSLSRSNGYNLIFSHYDDHGNAMLVGFRTNYEIKSEYDIYQIFEEAYISNPTYFDLMYIDEYKNDESYKHIYDVLKNENTDIFDEEIKKLKEIVMLENIIEMKKRLNDKSKIKVPGSLKKNKSIGCRRLLKSCD